MAERLHKFVQRSPRYVLRPQDRKDMRFSLETTLGDGGIQETLLLNLSETGVAFLVDAGFEPRVGERIKVEVPIPGGEQIAWWAIVVRTSEYGGSGFFSGPDTFDITSKVVVAMRFEADMPGAHTRAIQRGLKDSFTQTMRDQKFRDWWYSRQDLFRNVVRFAAYFLITAFALGFIYYFTLPDEKYDAKRGTLWGDRFKF